MRFTLISMLASGIWSLDFFHNLDHVWLAVVVCDHSGKDGLERDPSSESVDERGGVICREVDDEDDE